MRIGIDWPNHRRHERCRDEREWIHNIKMIPRRNNHFESNEWENNREAVMQFGEQIERIGEQEI